MIQFIPAALVVVRVISWLKSLVSLYLLVMFSDE